MKFLDFKMGVGSKLRKDFGILAYSPVRIRRGVSNRRGGSGKISKTLQEGGHFLIRGGSDKPKMLQEGGP